MTDTDHPADVEVVTVDDSNTITGTAPRGEAHSGEGMAHLAVSVMVVHHDGRLLLQRRAAAKPLFADLWSNAVCTHPLPGEEPITAASRRLEEELRIRCPLEPAGTFRYIARDPSSGLVENELDHVFVGRSDAEPRPEPSEVSEVRWITTEDLAAERATSADRFTPWFAQVLAMAGPHLDPPPGPAGSDGAP